MSDVINAMRLTPGGIYHVYNRGNDRRPIFFKHENYLFFIRKMEKYLLPCTDLLAWVLMPNHFHFLIHANENTCPVIREKPAVIDRFGESIRLLLSSYSKAINKQESMTGNVFQQRTKCKCVNDRDDDFTSTAFHYIHQNPYRAGLVERLSEWEFSSIHEYAEPGTSLYAGRQLRLCNVELGRQLVDLGREDIIERTYRVIPNNATSNIYHKIPHEQRWP